MCLFTDCGRKPECLEKTRQGKNMQIPVHEPEPNPEASQYSVSVLTAALCNPSLFFCLSLSFKHQIQFVFSPSADLMGSYIIMNTQLGPQISHPGVPHFTFCSTLILSLRVYTTFHTLLIANSDLCDRMSVCPCLEPTTGKASPIGQESS